MILNQTIEPCKMSSESQEVEYDGMFELAWRAAESMFFDAYSKQILIKDKTQFEPTEEQSLKCKF